MTASFAHWPVPSQDPPPGLCPEKELILDIERAAANDDLEYTDELLDAKGFIEEALHIANQDNQKFHFKKLVIATI